MTGSVARSPGAPAWHAIVCCRIVATGLQEAYALAHSGWDAVAYKGAVDAV